MPKHPRSDKVAPKVRRNRRASGGDEIVDKYAATAEEQASCLRLVKEAMSPGCPIALRRLDGSKSCPGAARA